MTNNGISPIILGDGARVINQYPESGIVSSESHIFLLTDGKKFTMPDLTGYSKSDVMTFCNLLNLKPSRTKELLKALTQDIEQIGNNKNRKYRLK